MLQDLERKLAEILRLSFKHCHTLRSKIRLLEVFEGISGRPLVRAHLRQYDQALVLAFTDEIAEVRSMFEKTCKDSDMQPELKNMPTIVSKLTWLHGLRERIQVCLRSGLFLTLNRKILSAFYC